jgi:hypothetical protein
MDESVRVAIDWWSSETRHLRRYLKSAIPNKSEGAVSKGVDLRGLSTAGAKAPAYNRRDRARLRSASGSRRRLGVGSRCAVPSSVASLVPPENQAADRVIGAHLVAVGIYILIFIGFSVCIWWMWVTAALHASGPIPTSLRKGYCKFKQQHEHGDDNGNNRRRH